MKTDFFEEDKSPSGSTITSRSRVLASLFGISLILREHQFREDNVEGFDPKWDEALLSMQTKPDKATTALVKVGMYFSEYIILYVTHQMDLRT